MMMMIMMKFEYTIETNVEEILFILLTPKKYSEIDFVIFKRKYV